MMHIDVDVQYPSTVFEQFQYGDYDVVDIAEAGRLEFLCVMQPATPVDGDVAAVVVQLGGAVQRSAGVHGAEVEEAVEHGTVVSYVEVAQVLGVALQVLRRDALQEFHVVLRVEATHVVGAGTVRPVNLHFPVEAVIENEAVNHGEPVRLHGMARPVVEVTHLRVVEVRHLLVVAHVDVICATRGFVSREDGRARRREEKNADTHLIFLPRGRNSDLASTISPAVARRVRKVRVTKG